MAQQPLAAGALPAYHRRPLRLLTGALALLLVAASPAATVVAVHDGDTVTLDTGERIRLAEIDAPELSQPYGHEARALLITLLAGPVTVAPVSRDRYGRIVAHLSAGGHDVGRALVAAGAAWCYTRYLPARSDCPAVEAAARAAGAGLWAASDPMPPWIWRKGFGTGKK